MKEESSWVDRIEENLIAVILGAMALLTFANVVARYVFNSNIFWALELTVFLFAWLVLLGATYAVKKTSHLGVDAIINMLGAKRRRILALMVAFVCIFYALLMLKGSWDYWAPYANMPPTEGRWFPPGFAFTSRGLGWYETLDIPVPFFIGWIDAVLTDFRFIQAGISVWKGKIDMMIVRQEAEEDVEEANKAMAAEEKK